ncbi:unnamed protein product [Diamesa serratosioi]
MLNDYMSETSIHGFRYLMEGKRINGVFWFIALMFSVVGCVFLIKQTYSKWNDNPVIVSFAQKATPLYTIPMPAITICPEIKYKRSFFNLTKQQNVLNVTDPTLISYQDALFSICPESYPAGSKVQIDYPSVLRVLAIPKSDIFASTDWRGNSLFHASFFDEILTDDGICYTYNMLNYKDLLNDDIDSSLKYPKHESYAKFWSLEKGYSIFSKEIYPVPIMGSGFKAGMAINLIALKEDLDYKCKGPVQGFKLALHSPTDFPRFTKQYHRIPLKKEVIITVEPKVLETAENLRKYSPQIRQCFFEGERMLRFFKIYTQPNCKLECLSNYTVKNCGCARLGNVHDNTTKVCYFGQQFCADWSETSWISRTWNPNGESTSESDEYEDDCNCLPSCNSISYYAESSYGDYYYNEFLESIDIKFDEDKYATLLRIYFEEDQFISVTRSELFGVVDFLSNCGGLLGLFMGISILSIVEFIYYFSLRWACTVKEKPSDDTVDNTNDKIRMVKEFDNGDLSTVSGSVIVYQN